MKHLSNRAFFAHWDRARGKAMAPDRADLAPEPVRHLLADVFVISCDAPSGYPLRIAGTRVCALAGRDLKGESFSALFEGDARSGIQEILGIVADEMLPTVAGLTASFADGRSAALELLLLPFAVRPHSPASLTGVLAPFDEGQLPLGPFRLASWRHIHPPKLISPRMIRRWNTLRGFTVYEGLR